MVSDMVLRILVLSYSNFGTSHGGAGTGGKWVQTPQSPTSRMLLGPELGSAFFPALKSMVTGSNEMFCLASIRQLSLTYCHHFLWVCSIPNPFLSFFGYCCSGVGSSGRQPHKSRAAKHPKHARISGLTSYMVRGLRPIISGELLEVQSKPFSCCPAISGR
jgi:hypothetical protein